MQDLDEMPRDRNDILKRRQADRQIIKALLDEDADALVTGVAAFLEQKGLAASPEVIDRIPVKLGE